MGNNCDSNAFCDPIRGCICQPGYQGDGKRCSGMSNRAVSLCCPKVHLPRFYFFSVILGLIDGRCFELSSTPWRSYGTRLACYYHLRKCVAETNMVYISVLYFRNNIFRSQIKTYFVSQKLIQRSNL